jgi:hypothetical protein
MQQKVLLAVFGAQNAALSARLWKKSTALWWRVPWCEACSGGCCGAEPFLQRAMKGQRTWYICPVCDPMCAAAATATTIYMYTLLLQRSNVYKLADAAT